VKIIKIEYLCAFITLRISRTGDRKWC